MNNFQAQFARNRKPISMWIIGIYLELPHR